MSFWRTALLALPLLIVSAGDDKAEKKREWTKVVRDLADVNFEIRFAERLKAYSEFSGDRRSAYVVSNNLPVVDSPQMRSMLDGAATRLLENWPGARPRVSFHILADSVPDARAYGSGVIVLSTGLLDKIPDQNALAFILAHELAHILADHEGKRQKLVDTAKTVSEVTTSALVYKDALRGSSFQNNQLQLKSHSSTVDLLVMSYATDALATDVLAPVVGRGQEYDADKIAVDLLVMAGFAPDACYSAIDLLLKSENKPHQRIDRMRALLTALMMSKVVDDSKQGQEKQLNQVLAVGAGLLTGAATKVVDLFAGGEADPDERREKFQAYRKAAYNDAFPPAMPDRVLALKTALQQGKNAPGWSTLVAAAEKASAARSLMKDVGAAKANNLAQPDKPLPVPTLPASATVPADVRVPLTMELRGDLAQVLENKAVAIREWQGATRSSWASKSLYQKLGRAYLEVQNRQQLAAVISMGKARSGDPRDFLDLEVGAARLNNNMVLAEKLTARCLREGGVDLYTRCALIIGYDAACSPRTEEGKPVLAAARLENNFTGLLNVAGQVDESIDKNDRGVGKKKSGTSGQCS